MPNREAGPGADNREAARGNLNAADAAREADAAAIQRAVEQFVELHGSGKAPDPLAFAGEHPDHLRGAILMQCREFLSFDGLLGAQPWESHEEPDTDGRPFGDFLIQEELGRGGMGIVYLAQQRSLNRRVALKVMASGLTLSKRHVERFRREAVASAKLRHPAIVSVHSLTEVDGTFALAMDYRRRPQPRRHPRRPAAGQGRRRRRQRRHARHRDRKGLRRRVCNAGRTDRFGPGDRAPEPGRAPRPETAQPDDRRPSPGATARFRPRQVARRGARPQPVDVRRDHRHGALHESGADARQARRGRPASRYLVARRDPLRAADAATAVRRQEPAADRLRDLLQGTGGTAQAQREGAARSGHDRQQGAREGPAEPLPDRRRVRGRPAALPELGADPRQTGRRDDTRGEVPATPSRPRRCWARRC